MATQLNKDVTRVTSVVKNDKPLYVTLTENQEVELKLKSERNSKKISIDDLYDQLHGIKKDNNLDGGVHKVFIGDDKFKEFLNHLKVNCHIINCEFDVLQIVHDVVKKSLQDVGLNATMLQKE